MTFTNAHFIKYYYLCVCERERERKKKKTKRKQYRFCGTFLFTLVHFNSLFFMSTCLCIPDVFINVDKRANKRD